MKLPRQKLMYWLNMLLIFSLMSNLFAPFSTLAAAPLPGKSVGLETTRRDNEPNITVKAAPLPSTLLFLDTLNPATGWTFENYAYVTNTDGWRHLFLAGDGAKRHQFQYQLGRKEHLRAFGFEYVLPLLLSQTLSGGQRRLLAGRD